MQRFYCTICKRVKRVRHLPVDISLKSNHVNPKDRIGECDKHSAPRVVKFSQVREQPVFAVASTKKVAGKRGR
jgi:hypothetical protein